MANDAVLGKVPASGHAASQRKRPEQVVIRSFPKIMLLYPTWIAAILAGICLTLMPNDEVAREWRIGFWFLVVAGLNLVVLAFDFPRTSSLTLVFCVVAVIFGALWLNYTHPFLPKLNEWVHAVNPHADSTFYWTLSGILFVIYVFVFIDTRFDYWEIMPNELIHHTGILGNVNRYPAPQLKLEKEITDVFEFLLLRSGRLLLHPSTERRAIVLETVPNINRRELEIQALLRVLDVHIHDDVETGAEH